MYRERLQCIRSSTLDIKSISYTDLVFMPISQRKRLSKYFDQGVVLAIKSGELTKSSVDLKTDTPSHIFARMNGFTEQEQMILPDWMMDSLILEDHEYVTVYEIIPTKCRSITIQPHKKELMNILQGDLSEILSPSVSLYSTITKNASIEIELFDQVWKIRVVEVKDQLGRDKRGGCIMNADVETNIIDAIDSGDFLSSNRANSLESVPESTRANSLESKKANSLESVTESTRANSLESVPESNKANSLESVPESNKANSLESNKANSLESTRTNSLESTRTNSLESTRTNSLESTRENPQESTRENPQESNLESLPAPKLSEQEMRNARLKALGF